MPIICPTVLAADKSDYKNQIERIAGFCHRIQIDLTDNDFAPAPTIPVDQVWWPAGVKADIHLMYRSPLDVLKESIKHSPNMIIVHSEAEIDILEAIRLCRDKGVKFGIALLSSTEPESIKSYVSKVDHILIFSGDLGKFGGYADLGLLDKVSIIRGMKPEIEIGWDGGVNDRNVSELVFGGVDVLNVGGYIQKADNPEKAYSTLFRIADETGTT